MYQPFWLSLFLEKTLLLQIAEIPAVHRKLPPETVRRGDELCSFFRKAVTQDFQRHRDIGYYASLLHVSPTYLPRVVRKASGSPVNGHVVRHLNAEAVRMLVLTYCITFR